ncbi:MAG: TetR/AcrR family transcriptional regulator [Roseibium sp.]
MIENNNKKQRFRQRDWLSVAMDVLSRKGSSKITIDGLCSELGVTKGSFYGHFENRNDFIQKLILYWAEEFTSVVMTETKTLDSQPAVDRLRALMHIVAERDLARYDVAVRAWATQEPLITDQVDTVFRKRFEYVRGLFREIGFSGAELDLRTEVFVAFHSSRSNRHTIMGEVVTPEDLDLRFRFFTTLSGAS